MIPSRRQLAAYGLPALPLAALGIPVHVHLPTFYAEDLGLGLAAVGSALLAARLVDVVADPVIGLVCDHGDRHTPWGRHRRKLWLAAALPVLAVAGWHLFRPAADAGPFDLAWWSALFYLGLTAMTVPFLAWGAEWSDDYAQRTRIAGWREAFALVGVVAAIAVPAALSLDRPATLALLLPAALALLLPAVALAAWMVPAPPPRPALPLSALPMSALRTLWGNRPFRRLLGAQTVNAAANALPATLFVLYVGDHLGRPDQSGPLLLAYLLAAIVSVPLWLALAHRHGKHRMWSLSLVLTALAFLPAVALAPDQWLVFAVLCVLTGMGLGADLALPAAMLADVVDEHSAQAGDGRAGLYAALWSLAGKLALAAAVGVAFPLLDRAGFVPGSGTAPLALPLLYAGFPVALKLAAAALVAGFPLDRARHAELRRRIAQLPETPP